MTSTAASAFSSDPASVSVDIAVFGGGIAGLWLANLLQQRGYSTVLLETGTLGGGQTLLSQGIIHGGLKYALGGTLSSESESIAEMPQRWRDCLSGQGELDLRQVQTLSATQHMWSTGSVASRVTGFFASKMIRGRIEKLNRNAFPAILQHDQFKGSVYRLDDLVIDTPSLIDALVRPIASHLLHFDPAQHTLHWHPQGLASIELGHVRLCPAISIFAAGTGNEWLLAQAQQHALAQSFHTQRRPLKMVLMKHSQAYPLYAHCIGASNKPRLTVTTHPLPGTNQAVWYLGGELAEKGAHQSDAALIDSTRQELSQLFPWHDFSGAEFATVSVDRAEPRQDNLLKPDSAVARRSDDLILCWPTKLTLAPDLGDKVLDLIASTGHAPSHTLPALPDGMARPRKGVPLWVQLWGEQA